MKCSSFVWVSLIGSLGAGGPVAFAEASSSRDVTSIIKGLLPRGWTLETEALPPGVRGVAVGPATLSGRAVIMLTELDGGADASDLDTEQSRKFLEKRLDGARVVEASIAGTTEVASTPREKREIRYLIATGKPSYLLTIVAPSAAFDETYALVVELATRLRRSTSRG